MSRETIVRSMCAVAAAALVGWSATLPLWQMRMEAPQYPKGLRLHAYGTSMSGDIPELNILNHYIGMPPIEAPVLETTLFPYGIAALVVLCLLSPVHRWLRRLAIGATLATPVAILADLQWRLYAFGHSLNPKAPIRLKPFTPLVIGETQMGNFESHAMVSAGFFCLVAAAVLLISSGYLARRFAPKTRTAAVRGATAAAAVALVLAAGGRAQAVPGPLQPRIDAALPGSTVIVEPGVYAGPIVIRGPLTVIAPRGATIDGGGVGSVVTIEGKGVELRGFTIRNSGRDVTEEAAGVKMTGEGHILAGNRIEDVYFGLHLGDSRHLTIQDNVITPGERHGARPGHGINAWHVRDSAITGNRISHARDGIYLSFTARVVVRGNDVRECRYGLHSMYSEEATFEDNTVAANLLGSALMMSDRLVFSRNRIVHHREGAAAYGLMLKDIGDLRAEDNQILGNRIGIYAEGVPSDPRRAAVFERNVLAGNEVALALQSTAAMTITRNRFAGNLTDVRPLGRQLSAGMQWVRDGRGNSWDRYRGYDADGDGIGDLPYTLEDAMDALMRRNPAIQAFLYTPAHRAIEAAARMFPLARQPAVLIDTAPLMVQPAPGDRHD
jgi:nitrous oxidase accessory protein